MTEEEERIEQIIRMVRSVRFAEEVNTAAGRHGLRSRQVWSEARRILERMPHEVLIHHNTIPNVVRTAALFARARNPR